MLGPTDPSHIIRCIEYWDIERRRYPAYDHVAVLVAEDITSRFLNVMALLAGSIPLIAIQMVALRVDAKICLHFVRVLDQTALRSDDTFVAGGRTDRPITDRLFWQAKVAPDVLLRCDAVAELMRTLTERQHQLRYRKVVIDVLRDDDSETPVWINPQKTLLRVGAYVPDPETWAKRFTDVGQLASLRRGNKAVAVSFTPEEFDSQRELLKQFLDAAITTDVPPE